MFVEYINNTTPKRHVETIIFYFNCSFENIWLDIVWKCGSFYFFDVFKSIFALKNIKLMFFLMFFDDFDVLIFF